MGEAKDQASAAFAERLCAAMRNRGFVSSSSRSGVDVAALAKVAGTTYEMARRYAEGAAVPRADKLDLVARWLGLPPAALLWGHAPTDAVDKEVLERCVAVVLEAQQKTGKSISNEKAARVVALIYGEAIAGRFPEARSIELLLLA